MKDTVCAVVVTFNRKQLLLKCIDSLLNQTHKINAIYIVDNNSTDNTPQLLYEKGYIKKASSKNRTIELLVNNEYADKRDNVIDVALLGNIAAGNPIEAIEQPDEFFKIPAGLVNTRKELFALNVHGESMINKGIFNDDIVIIERSKVAHNGEIVAAMTDDNEVTLKTFYKEKNHIRLQPENDTMEPLIFKNITILGTAIGLYRKI